MKRKASSWQSGSSLRNRQRRSKAAVVLKALHNNLLPQDEEECEIFPMASQKEVDRCIARMFLRMGGERIGDAVTESEGEGRKVVCLAHRDR